MPQIEGLAFSVEGLRRDADEIEAWGAGNEAAAVRWAAAEMERLRALETWAREVYFRLAAARQTNALNSGWHDLEARGRALFDTGAPKA